MEAGCPARKLRKAARSAARSARLVSPARFWEANANPVPWRTVTAISTGKPLPWRALHALHLWAFYTDMRGMNETAQPCGPKPNA